MLPNSRRARRPTAIPCWSAPPGKCRSRPRSFPISAINAITSFIPLNMIASFPLVLVVPADHPVKSVKELVAWAKANPDKSNYGTSSPAFTIASELLKLKTGMPAVAIPYKSSNEFESRASFPGSVCSQFPTVRRRFHWSRAARPARSRSPAPSARPSCLMSRAWPRLAFPKSTPNSGADSSCRQARLRRSCQAHRGTREGARRSRRAGGAEEDGRNTRRPDGGCVQEAYRCRHQKLW